MKSEEVALGFPADGKWVDLLDTIIVDHLASQGIILAGWFDTTKPPPTLPAKPARGNDNEIGDKEKYLKDPKIMAISKLVTKQIVAMAKHNMLPRGL